MVMQEESPQAAPAKVPEPQFTPPPAEDYDLHVRVSHEMRPVLKKIAELTYLMGDISKPDLSSALEFLLGLGIMVQKKRWLESRGYR